MLNQSIFFLVIILIVNLTNCFGQTDNLKEKKLSDSIVLVFQKKIDKNPHLLEPKIELAEYYFSMKNFDKAEKIYESISKHKKIDFKSQFNLSYSLSMLGKYDRSRELLLKLKTNSEVVGNGDLNILLEHNINANDLCKKNQTSSFWTLDSLSNIKSTENLEPEILANSKTYLGSIIDEVSNNFLDNTWVYLKNLDNGEEKKVMTNKYGEYAFMLKPETDYQIRCYKNGYQSLFFSINTGTGDRKTILGEKKMKKIDLNDLEKIEGLNVSKCYTKYNDNSNIPEKVYMIQLGVLNELNLDQNLYLSKFSNIIKEPYLDTEYYLYRVGVFTEEKYARESLDSIKKLIFFKDAFLVPIELKTKEAKLKSLSLLVKKNIDIKPIQLKIENPSKDVDSNTFAKKNELINSNDKVNVKNDLIQSKDSIITYKIQLGAFKKADERKFSELKSFGKIESWFNESKGLTYYFISEFSDLKQAEKIKIKVTEKGVKGAYVVKFINGQRV